MTTAKVFRSGNSQAVRLPKEFRFKAKEVEVFRRGDEVVLREKPANMARAYELITDLPDDLEPPTATRTFPRNAKACKWNRATCSMPTSCIYIRQKRSEAMIAVSPSCVPARPPFLSSPTANCCTER